MKDLNGTLFSSVSFYDEDSANLWSIYCVLVVIGSMSSPPSACFLSCSHCLLEPDVITQHATELARTFQTQSAPHTAATAPWLWGVVNIPNQPASQPARPPTVELRWCGCSTSDVNHTEEHGRSIVLYHSVWSGVTRAGRWSDQMT